LYYRIGVLEIKMPKLSERREDVPALAQYFRAYYQKLFAKECDPVEAEIVNYLENLPWPGNLRELSNCIARYVLIGRDAFTVQDLSKKRAISSASDSGVGRGLPLRRIAKEAIRELERNVILEALRTHQWNRRKTAQALKISYRALIYKIQDAGLSRRNGQQGGGAQNQDGYSPAPPGDEPTGGEIALQQPAKSAPNGKIKWALPHLLKGPQEY
jgi:two-component system response regulator AtoC